MRSTGYELEKQEETMALSSLAQAFVAACNACRDKRLDLLEPMLHEKVTATYIDSPLTEEPIVGKTEFIIYLTGKTTRDPATELEISPDDIEADERTGIVEGAAIWHDND